MTMTKPLLACLLVATTAAPAATEQRRSGYDASDQKKVRDRVQRGEIRTLSEIESRVVPRMRGADYLGPEIYDDTYRLKFMQNGSVIWVDVDARTGQIIGRTGH